MSGSRTPATLLVLAMVGLSVATAAADLTGRQERFGVLLLPQLAAVLVLGGALAMLLRPDLVAPTEEAAGMRARALIPPVAGVGYILAARWLGPVLATASIVPVLAVLGGARGARAVLATTVATVVAVVLLFLGAMGTWFPSDVRLI